MFSILEYVTLKTGIKL